MLGNLLFTRLISRRIQHKLVEREITQPQCKYDNNGPIQQLAARGRDGLRAIHFRIALQPLWSQLICPGDNGGRNEADGEHRNDDSDRLVRQAIDREQGLDDLDQQPGDSNIGHRDADHVTPFELLEQVHSVCSIRISRG